MYMALSSAYGPAAHVGTCTLPQVQLVDWPRPPVDASVTCQHGSCEDPQTATAYCTDCEMYLCAAHYRAHVHDEQRQFSKHSLLVLHGGGSGSGRGRAIPVSTCRVHPGERLTRFCCACKEAFCSHGDHANHMVHKSPYNTDYAPIVWELEEAARFVRQSLCKADESDYDLDSYYSRLKRDLANFAGSQELLDDKVLKISNYIEEAFTEHHERLRRTEKRFRDDLDQMYWRECKQPLGEDERREMAMEGLRLLQIVRFLQRDLDDAAVVQVGAKLWEHMDRRKGILEELQQNANPVLYRYSSPTPEQMTVSMLSCYGDEGLQALVHRHVEEGRLLSHRLPPEDKLPIVEAPQDLVSPIQYADDNSDHSSGTEESSEDEEAVYDFLRPRQRTFDSARSSKSQNIVLSQGNKTATARFTRVAKLRSVRANFIIKKAWKLKLRFTICIRDADKPLMIGIADEDLPMTEDNSWSHGSSFCGWSSVFPHDDRVLGGQLGQPWWPEEVIHFFVDAESRKVRALHESSGEEDTLSFPRCDCVFRAELTDGTCITLIKE